VSIAVSRVANREDRIETILKFWFGDLKSDTDYPTEKAKLWFRGGEAFDERVRRQFGEDLKMAEVGKLDSWKETSRGALALIILLDQFTRNIYGDTPEAFAQDKKALGISSLAMQKGFDLRLKPVERHFIYMPFMHSEDPEHQRMSLELYAKLANESPPDIEIPLRILQKSPAK